MLTNIIDRRRRPYRWQHVTAIVEPTSADNVVVDADITVPTLSQWFYHELEDTSLAGAIAWAGTYPEDTTLYLYDLGDGICEVKRHKTIKERVHEFLRRVSRR